MKTYVVHGPPLSGKSTYVQRQKGPNDLVFDFDLVMAALTGLPVHQHNEHLVSYVVDIRGLIIARLKSEENLDNAWIIATRVTPRLKHSLEGLDVEYIELQVDIETAKERLHQDPDGRDIKVWEQVIDRHFGVVGEERRFYKTAEWKRKRLEILERDNHECQECKREGRFSKGNVVHHVLHLDDRPDLALETDNLLTVCEACHNKLHPERLRRRAIDKKEHIAPERW